MNDRVPPDDRWEAPGRSCLAALREHSAWRTAAALCVLAVAACGEADAPVSEPPAGEGLFVSAAGYERNLKRQLEMCGQAITALRQAGVTPEMELRLEYFFYSDSLAKVQGLTDYLDQWQYAGRCGPSADEPAMFLATGRTPKMAMDEATIREWVRRMCEAGRARGCEFDGWGTSPDQG